MGSPGKVRREATDEDLQEFLDANAESYRRDTIFTFRQVYLNPEKRGANIEADAQAYLDELRSGEIEGEIGSLGDSLMLDSSFQGQSASNVARTFGREFVEELTQAPAGEWHGPVKSGYGLHLVKVDQRIDGQLPDLDEAREQVLRDWSAQKRIESNEAIYQKWKEGYTITIEEYPGNGEVKAE